MTKPDVYQVRLERFEGPLALLMHLIEKNQVDIYDIPIAELTEQYLGYLQAMQSFDINIASDFLVMAATLLQIKSRMLLPRPKVQVEEVDDEADPRQELVDRLLEYRRFKLASLAMEELMQQRTHYFFRSPQAIERDFSLPPGLTIEDLMMAFAALWESNVSPVALVAPEEISVQDKMTDILYFLRNAGGPVDFRQTLFRSGKPAELVSGFLALLELIRLQQISIYQQVCFGPITIMLRKDVG